jgi:menaquinone reductase, multiheme cytochrome c subunit
MNGADGRRVVFPRWANLARPALLALLVGTPLYLTALVYFGFSPLTTDVGYRPEQGVPYSHALHAGQLGMDCRYCHTTVERAAFAAVPAAKVCMNCHATVRTGSPRLTPIRDAGAGGPAVAWVKVHDLPDYVYFDHSAHVRRGVGCVECHGRVDRMEVVEQVAPLSMGWCLDCHRNPEAHLRPPELVTNMGWTANGDPAELGRTLRRDRGINPPQDCSACHR